MIRIVSDLHTHTTHSRRHGKGSVEDNVKAAIQKGLSAVAISDHGFAHLCYPIGDAGRYLAEIAEVKQKYAGQIDVFSCAEFNLVSFEGDLDIPPGYENAFDLKMFGYHKLVGCGAPTKTLRMFLAGGGARAVARNTDAYIAAMEKNGVDMISHPGYGLAIDKTAVARAAARLSVALEISAKHNEFTPEELRACARTGVRFVVGSDAHSPDRVGDFGAAVARAEQAGITAAQIINAEE